MDQLQVNQVESSCKIEKILNKQNLYVFFNEEIYTRNF
jgi:hypothetical protein